MRLSVNSIEHLLKLAFSIAFVVVMMLVLSICYLLALEPLTYITVLLFCTILLAVSLMSVYRKILSPLNDLLCNVEAFCQRDFKINAKAHYQGGIYSMLQAQLLKLGAELQHSADNYHKEIYLTYQLISQLDVPILVFDPQLRFTHGNTAFDKWYGAPWQTLCGTHATQLGLNYSTENEWQIESRSQSRSWQVKASCFFDNGQRYHLVVLNNITKELNSTQQKAWQQMVRVLGHEIKNSLTPIKSLTQSMLTKDDIAERYKGALQVIHERSDKLQSFVSHYSEKHQDVEINPVVCNFMTICQRITGLFSDIEIECDAVNINVFADEILLEQVLINLLKNASQSILQRYQSMENQQQYKITDFAKIQVKAKELNRIIEITVTDNGIGITNAEDCFVPYYTTKPDGQGIGLYFCRNIIEKHGGALTLHQGTDCGAEARIVLPIRH